MKLRCFSTKAIILMMAFLCMALNSAYAEEAKKVTASHTAYSSLSDEHGAPLPASKARTDFDCSDKIYSVVSLHNYPNGKHRFAARWIDPSGKAREHTRYPFAISEQKQVKLWSTISLYRSTGAGMLQLINPAAGMDEFIGEWEVQIRIDDRKISTQHFEVNC